MKSKLILIRSFPGSGKTTFARNRFPNILKIENDQFHYRNGEYCFNMKKQELAIQWCIDVALLSMSKGMDVCISNTFTKKKYIDSYMKFAKDFGYDVEVYRMMGKFKNVHKLDDKIVFRFEDAMEDYDGEMYVYPVPGVKDSYRVTKLKIGDIVESITKDTVSTPRGTISNIKCLENGELLVEFRTEDTLFSKSKLLWCDADRLTKI